MRVRTSGRRRPALARDRKIGYRRGVAGGGSEALEWLPLAARRPCSFPRPPPPCRSTALCLASWPWSLPSRRERSVCRRGARSPRSTSDPAPQPRGSKQTPLQIKPLLRPQPPTRRPQAWSPPPAASTCGPGRRRTASACASLTASSAWPFWAAGRSCTPAQTRRPAAAEVCRRATPSEWRSGRNPEAPPPSCAAPQNKRCAPVRRKHKREEGSWNGGERSLGRSGGTPVMKQESPPQVSSSADGITGWSRWQLLSLDAPAPGPSTNLYFFNVHALGPGRLIAVFPAAFPAPAAAAPAAEHLHGGVFTASSTDGLHWSAPRLILSSKVRAAPAPATPPRTLRAWSHMLPPLSLPAAQVYAEWRTTAWPIDGILLFHPGPHAPAPGSASLLIEHGVRLEHGPPLHACTAPPLTCRYQISLRELWEMSAPPRHPDAGRRMPGRRFLSLAPVAESRATPRAARRPRASSISAFRQGALPAWFPPPTAADVPFGAPLPPQPRRCAAPRATAATALPSYPLTHVLLLRGQPFRWGCSAHARQRQAAAYRSHFTHILAPVEAAGGCVRLVLASHGAPCGLAAHASTVALFSGRVRADRVEANLSSQAQVVARAVQLHRSHALPQDATLFVSRHDLTLRAPIGACALPRSRRRNRRAEACNRVAPGAPRAAAAWDMRCSSNPCPPPSASRRGARRRRGPRTAASTTFYLWFPLRTSRPCTHPSARQPACRTTAMGSAAASRRRCPTPCAPEETASPRATTATMCWRRREG